MKLKLILIVALGLAALFAYAGYGSDPAAKTEPPSTGPAGPASPAAEVATSTPPPLLGAGDWRLDRDRVLSSAEPPFARAEHPLKPTGLWGSLSHPLPTNSAWMNLVLEAGDHRISLFPYDVRALEHQLSIAYPRRNVSPRAIVASADEHLRVGASSPAQRRCVAAFDDLSVTVRWDLSEDGTMTAPLVFGSPFVTVFYEKARPEIEAASGAAVVDVKHGGRRSEIVLNNGQRWLVYASDPVTWERDGNQFTASAIFSGSIRVALALDDTAVAVLDRHAGAIPVGGVVDAIVAGDSANVVFTFRRRGDGPLLMGALPHHRGRLRGAGPTLAAYSTLRGELSTVAGDSWVMEYALPVVGWTAPRPVAAPRKAAIRAALLEDKAFIPDAKAIAEDPYFGGKQLAKLARLILIADELGEAAAASELTERLRAGIEPWLTGANANPLVYDAVWGGLVTKGGMADRGRDFGQGYYNDHHFHYGYLIYAGAVVAKRDPAWGMRFKEHLLALARDILNPSSKDRHFPRFRNLDWYEGHSWAAGLFVFGDNRNQESTSEAVHAWHAVQVLGLALGDTNLFQLGRLAAAVEIDGARTYWQIRASDRIYPSPFREFGCVGVLWSTKVDAVTFFGDRAELVHGIQMIPFTPITEDLLDPAWVTDAWPIWEKAAVDASESWAGFLHLAHGVNDPASAWTAIEKLKNFDDGNSRTNSLWWLATRGER